MIHAYRKRSVDGKLMAFEVPNGRKKDWEFFNNPEEIQNTIAQVKSLTEFTGAGPVLFLIQKKPIKFNGKAK